MKAQNQIVKQIIEAEHQLSAWDLEKVAKGEATLAEMYKQKIQYMITYREQDLKNTTEKLKNLNMLHNLCDELFPVTDGLGE